MLEGAGASASSSGSPHRVVVIGGGFGGLHLARALRRVPVHLTLVDRRNFHLFQPLLYQVATGTLSPANICAPLRWVLRRQRNAEVLLGEAIDFDLARREVVLREERLRFDTLVLAAGSRYDYFGHDAWRLRAPGLKTIENATEIRRRVLLAFERAERARDPARRRELLTFAIVGAGATGVELAGALAEIARHTLRRDFRRIDPGDARIVLIEGLDRVLASYAPTLSQKAARRLETLGVEVRTGCLVEEVLDDRVRFACGDGVDEVAAHTILWTAGVRASPLAERLARATGAELDRAGRIAVAPDLSLPGHPEIFAIGDLARFETAPGSPLPGVAPVAIQQGRYVAQRVRARLDGRSLPPFRYRDRGSMATIGRSAAIADLRGLRFDGLAAWLAWLLVHLLQLITFQNRVLVLVQWIWHYITFNKSARLITGCSASRSRAPRR